jgi:hypothetical protein
VRERSVTVRVVGPLAGPVMRFITYEDKEQGVLAGLYSIRSTRTFLPFLDATDSEQT